jgi:hypothetical protein
VVDRLRSFHDSRYGRTRIGFWLLALAPTVVFASVVYLPFWWFRYHDDPNVGGLAYVGMALVTILVPIIAAELAHSLWVMTRVVHRAEVADGEFFVTPFLGRMCRLRSADVRGCFEMGEWGLFGRKAFDQCSYIANRERSNIGIRLRDGRAFCLFNDGDEAPRFADAIEALAGGAPGRWSEALRESSE